MAIPSNAAATTRKILVRSLRSNCPRATVPQPPRTHVRQDLTEEQHLETALARAPPRCLLPHTFREMVRNVKRRTDPSECLQSLRSLAQHHSDTHSLQPLLSTIWPPFATVGRSTSAPPGSVTLNTCGSRPPASPPCRHGLCPDRTHQGLGSLGLVRVHVVALGDDPAAAAPVCRRER